MIPALGELGKCWTQGIQIEVDEQGSAMEDTQPPRVGLDPPDWLLHSARMREGPIPTTRSKRRRKPAIRDLQSPNRLECGLPDDLKCRPH